MATAQGAGLDVRGKLGDLFGPHWAELPVPLLCGAEQSAVCWLVSPVMTLWGSDYFVSVGPINHFPKTIVSLTAPWVVWEQNRGGGWQSLQDIPGSQEDAVLVGA